MLTQRSIENSTNKIPRKSSGNKTMFKHKSQKTTNKKLDDAINSFTIENIQSGNMFDILVEDFNKRVEKHKKGTIEERRFVRRIIKYKESKNNGTIVYDSNEKKFILNEKVKRNMKLMKGGMWPFSSESSETTLEEQTALADRATTQVSNFTSEAERGMSLLLTQLQERNELTPTSMAQIIELQRQLLTLKQQAANEEVARQRELARIRNETNMVDEVARRSAAETKRQLNAITVENAKLIGTTLKQIITRVFFLVAAYGVSSLAMGTLSIGEASVGAVGGVVGSATGFLASATDYVTYGATLGYSGTSVSEWWEQGTQVGSEVREGYHDARTGLQISITLAVYGLIELTNAIVTFIRNMDEISIAGLFRFGRSSSRNSETVERIQTPSSVEEPLDTPQQYLTRNRISGQQSSAATALAPTLAYSLQPLQYQPSSSFNTRRALTPPPSDSVQELNSNSVPLIDYDLNSNNNTQTGGMLKMRKKRKLRSRRKKNVKSHKNHKTKSHKGRKTKSHKKRSKQTRKK